jgi:CubicO group peptidase (beta-lactamase class C family)
MLCKSLSTALALLAVAVFAGHSEIAFADATKPVAHAAATPEDDGFSREGLAALEAYVRERVGAGAVPGAVIYLARHGKTVLFNGYGARSVGGPAMTKDTIFRAYSITKPVTALGLMILYEEGKWKLDDPITKYLPELAGLKVFRSLGADGKPVLEDAKRAATMRELMTHTAGFAYGLAPSDYVNKAYQDEKIFLRRDLPEFVATLKRLPLIEQPGERWIYSVASDLQGYIIERISGEPLDVFFKKRIFDRARMIDTGFFVPPENVSRLAPIYARELKDGKLVDVSSYVGDFTKPPTLRLGGGGLLTTASDYARFCQMLLNGGEIDGVRIVRAETVALMGTNLLPADVWVSFDGAGGAVQRKGLGYGLGVAVVADPSALGTPQGEGTIGWGGAGGTIFWVDRKNDLFFVFMIQRFLGFEQFGDNPRRLVYEALRDRK